MLASPLVDESLRAAVDLFNAGRYAEFQDAVEGLISQTRAHSERRFYALLDNLSEALLQLSDGDVAEAAAILAEASRKFDEFLPRFRGINVQALREDFQRLHGEIRDASEGRPHDFAPSRLPRLRVLPE